MAPQLSFFLSIGFSVVAWSVVGSRYVWPRLRDLANAGALRPLLVVHSFRFIGLAFLVSGVVSPDLPPSFAHSAAYGDAIAATLALLSLASTGGLGTIAAWIFNLWGSFDIFSAFYQANRTGLSPGQLGATFFIPTLIVPMLLISHVLMFRILLRRQRAPELARGRRSG